MPDAVPGDEDRGEQGRVSAAHSDSTKRTLSEERVWGLKKGENKSPPHFVSQWAPIDI